MVCTVVWLEEREQEIEREKMDVLDYCIKRILDVAAVIALRAAYLWVDRYLSSTTGVGGVAAGAGTSLGTGSGTGSAIVGAGGPRRSPGGGQPSGCVGGLPGGSEVVVVLTDPDGGEVVLDLTEAE